MKVMVAIDGSRSADDAVSMVPWLGSCDEVILVNAVDLIFPIFQVEAALSYWPDLEREAELRGATLLERARQYLLGGRRRVATELLAGSPAGAIVDAARRERVDLVVVGARGLGLVKEALLGSVSHSVVAHAPCPVLVVRGHAGPMVSVLLAVESVADADAMISFLAKSPFPSAVRIHVLTVAPLYGVVPELEYQGDPWALRSDLRQHRRFAAEVADRVRDLGYQATATSLMGSPADEILLQSETDHADVIVLGSRGRSAASRFLLGSVAHAVTHRATCPVLVVPRRAAVHTTKRTRHEVEKEAVR